MVDLIQRYIGLLTTQLQSFDWEPLERLATQLSACIASDKQVFICGNGGSAGNAMHLANDFTYGIDPSGLSALKVEALTSNSSVITCLANDTGYDNIYSHQLKVKGHSGDLLLVLSGSGNSPNILKAIKQAKLLGIKTSGILGFDGGKAKELLDIPIHFSINDMQISEDLQLVAGHMLMQYLASQSAKGVSCVG